MFVEVIPMNRFKEERTRLGLSLQKEADALSVHVNTVVGWEEGRFEPSARNIVQLTSLFGCSADYLLGLSDERNGKGVDR